MRSHSYNFLFTLLIYYGTVFGVPLFNTSNTSDKTQNRSFSMRKYTTSEKPRNITSDGNVTNELPQKNNLLERKDLQSLYHEAYLLLKDVIKTRKLNNNASSIDVDTKRDPKLKEVRRINKTSSSRQTFLGQSPLPPYKTRQGSFSTAVTNSSVTATLNASKLLNYLNSTKNQQDDYFRISTADQAEYVSALLGITTKLNNTTLGANEGTSVDRIKLFPRNNTRWENRKGLLANNTKDGGFPDNIMTTSANVGNSAKQKTSGQAFEELKLVLKSSDNKNESRIRNANTDQKVQNTLGSADDSKKLRVNNTSVNRNSSKPQLQANRTKNVSTISSSSDQYSLLTQEIVVEIGKKRDESPDDTCYVGDVKYNQTLKFGLNAGKFLEEGKAKTIDDCIYQCCSRKSCDVAFMLKESCFLVKCHNKTLCESREAKSLSYHPRLARVFRRRHGYDQAHTKGRENQSLKRYCSYSKLIQNKTLHGGIAAGFFSSHGVVKTLKECAKYCCDEEQCDVTYMVDDICYSVQCKDEESCKPVEITHPKTKVSLAFVSRGFGQPVKPTIDLGKIKSLTYTEGEQPEQVSWFCKASNVSKVFTNVNLLGGLRAGKFTDKGAVSSYHQCAGYCCQDKHCNVAMTLGNNCFLVACKTYTACLPRKAKDVHSQVVYVNWKTPSEKVRIKGKILYKDLGCWHEDEKLQSLMSLEGTDDLLQGSYKSRRNKITKCAMAARKRNFKVFALHNGGECRSGQSEGKTYQAHGKSRSCHEGVGNYVSNHVYHVKENGTVVDHGCWKAIQKEENFVTLESTDGRIKEKYKERNNSLLKCAEAAISQGHALFALRDGGQCLAGNSETTSYKKNGVSKLCVDGMGSDSSKSVYQIIGTTQLTLQQHKEKPFLARKSKERLQAFPSSETELKFHSAKLFYKYSSPQSRVFIHGLKAGHFTNQGEVNDITECILHCGRQPDCSVAFMVRNRCLTVKCYSKKSCDTIPAVNSRYNPQLSVITRLASSMSSYKGKEKPNVDETRPFSTQSNHQRKVNKSSALKENIILKSTKDSNRTRYKHSSPQSRVFTRGIDAGNFTHHEEVNNMPDCIEYCGQQLECSAAFMVRHFCFTVACYNKESCDTAPAVHSGFNPRLSFITHLTSSQPEPVLLRRCETSKIYENVTLFGGIHAGNFTDFGEKDNMSHCISFCCEQKHCDVAFMLGKDCYGVQCKTKHLCGTTPAKHVRKYRPRLAYMSPKMENNTADARSLSSCWNGETLVNYTLTGGIDAGIFYSNGNTESMSTCMKYCCEQHDCDLAFRIDQGCYTVHCNDLDHCHARKARKTRFVPQIAFKRPQLAIDESKQNRRSDASHGSCQIGETHFNTTLKMGMHSGKFKNLGQVDNMEDCIEMCCKEKDIDAAFMLGKLCYSVKCYNSDLCQTRPAFISSIDMLNAYPAVSFIHNNDNNDDSKDYTRSEIERRCVVASIKKNTTLIGQLHGGTFSDNGERSNIQDCVSACCNTPLCDAALIQGKRCFSVQCSNNKTACQEVRADSLNTTSTLAYIARYEDSGHTQELELSTSTSQCPLESLNEFHVYRNKTLLGGFETGNYTFLGRTKNMRQCVQKCCSLGKCDVAYSIDDNCYGVECFSENLCNVDDKIPETTSTQISLMKDIKLKQSRRFSSYILPVLPVLLVVFIFVCWLYWLRSRKEYNVNTPCMQSLQTRVKDIK
ncbi:uncharacterized protein LOC114528113 isoform X2 [Dendronephthya gigantea]|uniref:uncharacterized protein LOC114528113 isoform X2 n=1 Tax=Dendronephthya gigantea TaxID=151771 RepID=UPI00106A3FE6|nr:uncharacterized protein LOC114528113 isoform X2 [Dendronephthya gigantea]